jgi:hypothetical protein
MCNVVRYGEELLKEYIEKSYPTLCSAISLLIKHLNLQNLLLSTLINSLHQYG